MLKSLGVIALWLCMFGTMGCQSEPDTDGPGPVQEQEPGDTTWLNGDHFPIEKMA